MYAPGAPLQLLGLGTVANERPPTKAEIHRLQTAINLVATKLDDRSLKVLADSSLGPTTTEKLNEVLPKVGENKPTTLARLRQSSGTVNYYSNILERAVGVVRKIPAAGGGGPATPSQTAAQQYLQNMGTEIARRVPSAQVQQVHAGMTTTVAPGGPVGGNVAATKDDIRALQAAVRAYGTRTGNKALLITADGVVGPKTISAVSAVVRRPVTRMDLSNKMTVQSLTMRIGQTVGVVVPLVKAPTVPSVAGKSTAVAALQNSLRKLGAKVGNKALIIAADGVAGPKTAAAVNLAFSQYIISAPAQYRTGGLSVADVRTQALALKTMVDADLTRRGGRPGSKARAPGGTASVTDLQRALVALAGVTQDRALLVAVDGRTGPKTAAAANRALTTHLKDVPAQYTTGRLSPVAVGAAAPVITGFINQELQRRGSTPVVPGPPETAAEDHAEAAQAVEQPKPSAEDGGSEPVPTATAPEPEAPVPTPYTPSVRPAAPPPAYSPATDEGGGGGGFQPPMPTPSAPAPEDGGGAMVPAAATPGQELAPPAKSFPWVPVGIGAGVVVVGVVAFVIASSRKRRR